MTPPVLHVHQTNKVFREIGRMGLFNVRAYVCMTIVVYKLSTSCLQLVYKLSTSCLHVVYNTSTNGSDFQMQWTIMNTNASPAQNHLKKVTIIFLQQLMPTAPPRNGRSHFTNT